MFDRIRRFFNSGLAKPAKWLVDALGGGKAVSGETVNEKTALGQSAYLACLKNISEDIAKMPCGVFQRMEPRGRKPVPNHPAHKLLHYETNEETSAMAFRETLTQHALGWHGGFAEIVRDGMGRPAAMYVLDPTSVEVKRTDSGVLYYQVGNVTLPASDVFHIHGLGFDALTGYVISRVAKDVIGNALAAQKFAGSYYANGTASTGVISIPGAWTEAAFKHFRESFHQRHGGPGNQHKPLILEDGATWQPMSSNPKDAQMIEVLQSGDVNIARLFRMPPHKIQDLTRGTFSNIEQQALEYVTDCLLGWAVRWEQEAWRKLLAPQEKKSLFIKHNFNMLLRGDVAARSAFYREMFNIGAFSDNDIREYEDMNPVDGGDTYFVNAAMVPLDIASTGEHLATMQPKEPTPEPNTPPDEDQRANPKPPASENRNLMEHKRELLGRVAAAHTGAIAEALAGVLRVEHDKASRAAKRKDSYVWARDYYSSGHKQHVSDRLKPHIRALSQSLEAVLWN